MTAAIVIGASGLVGTELVKELSGSPHFERTVSLGRRSLGLSWAGVTEKIVDFNAPASLEEGMDGDVLFSSLGTTRAKAGSKDAQWEVDHTFQLRAAEAAAKRGVRTYVLVSASTADAKSMAFYNRMKGDLDEAVQKLGFRSCHILRPSILDGDRAESRPGEKVGLAAMRLLRGVPGLRKHRPIHVRIVARAMIAAALDPREGAFVHGPEELFELGK